MRITEEAFREAVAESSTISEALDKLRLRKSSSSYKVFHSRVERWNVDTTHFLTASEKTAQQWAQSQFRARPLEEILVENSTYTSSNGLKKRLYREGLKERQCELCGQGETWQGKPLALHLDHINGNHRDNSIENLQIVCPNCHSTLDTYCGKKNKLKNTCKECSDPIRSDVVYCINCRPDKSVRTPAQITAARSPKPSMRKVERPPYERLLQEIESSSYVQVGKKYGVSDNAIRKWVRQYERELAPEIE